MAERVQIGSAVLHRADCLEMLGDLQCDVVLTDPVWPNCPPGLLPGSEDPAGLWRRAMFALPPISRLVAVLRCDSDPRFLSSVPTALPFFRSIQLPYNVPNFIGRVLGGDETAFWFGNAVRTRPGRQVIPGRAPSMHHSESPKTGHPCSRAQGHLDWLVNWCSDTDETVCDPFMGAGTTGVACVKLGRPFVGIEIEPRWFDLACARIQAAERQGDLFVPKPQHRKRLRATLM